MGEDMAGYVALMSKEELKKINIKNGRIDDESLKLIKSKFIQHKKEYGSVYVPTQAETKEIIRKERHRKYLENTCRNSNHKTIS